MIWWLSFADGTRPKGTQFLGVCIVDTGMEGAPETMDMLAAVQMTHALGINPGGEVQGLPCPEEREHLIQAKWLNRLLSREECEAIDAEMAGRTQ